MTRHYIDIANYAAPDKGFDIIAVNGDTTETIFTAGSENIQVAYDMALEFAESHDIALTEVFHAVWHTDEDAGKDAWAHLAEAMPDNRNNVIAAHRIRKHAMRAVLPTYGMRRDTAKAEAQDSRESEFEKAHREAREDLLDLITLGAVCATVALTITTLVLLVG